MKRLLVASSKPSEFLVKSCSQVLTVPGLYIESALKWDELRRIAKTETGCQNEEMEECFEFTNQVVKILEQNHRSHVCGISIPRALSYGFSSPFMEDFPLFVSALIHILKDRGIEEVTLWGGYSDEENLVADVAGHLGIRIVVKKHFRSWLRRQARVARAFLSALKLGLTLNSSRPPDIKDRPMFFMSGKLRSFRYIDPIRKLLEPMGIPTQVFGTVKRQNLMNMVLFFFEVAAQQRTWKTTKRQLEQIDVRYKGISIARHYLNEAKNIWCIRGAATVLLARNSEGFFRTDSHRGLFLIAPTESGYVWAERANAAKIPTFLYHSQFSVKSVANLWEQNMYWFQGEVFVLNQWVQERLIDKNILPSARIHVTGDVLCELPTEYARSQIKMKVESQLHLEKDKLIVLVLSRFISSDLAENQKRLLFLKSFEASQQVGAQLIIKGHPFEKKKQLEQDVSRWGVTAKVVIEEIPLQELAWSSDIVVTYAATSSVLDCLYAKVPVILVGEISEFDYLDRDDGAHAYRKYQAATCLQTGADMVDIFDSLLKNSEKRAEQIQDGFSYAQKVGGYTDGRASKRIVTIMTNPKVTSSGVAADLN